MVDQNIESPIELSKVKDTKLILLFKARVSKMI